MTTDGEETMPGLALYNTLTREKEPFRPIEADKVGMYVCGPTVYDFAHIGNARPVIVFDVLYRVLMQKYGKDAVTYVRNITDVDDKINARALETFGDEIAKGKIGLNDAIRQVTEETACVFQANMSELGCLTPSEEPRATENIDRMVSIIQMLLDKDHAYSARGPEGVEVLFRVASMDNYGFLSKRTLDEQQAGARVAVQDHKEDAADFVLWKQSDDKAPGWQGIFVEKGETLEIHGRPGWHIECSAMSERYLGKTFDIHGGGIDLVFPHHENEIAQSCCAFGVERMANYWMHNGFLQVEGEKMSKSLGNFITVHDLLETDKIGERRWPGPVIRLAMLMTHYREPIDFSLKRLEEAENVLKKLQRRAREGDDEGNLSALHAALADDLNTSAALHAMSALSGAPLKEAMDLLGLETEAFLADESVDMTAIKAKIDERLALIANKDWPGADKIRDDLLAQGIQLKDGKDPETGGRVTTWEVVS